MWQYVWNRVWERDPDFFRLKHAIKTVFAVVIATLLLSGYPLIVQLYAGLAAGFSIQGISGQKWQDKLLLLIGADIFYYLALLLGFFVRPYHFLSNITLIVLGFFVLYVRRFGDRFSLFPIFVWFFCFFSIIFPATISGQHFFKNSIGLLVGFLVGGLCFFLLFPKNPLSTFRKNTNRFYSSYVMSLRWLKSMLKKTVTPQEFFRQMKKNKSHHHNLMVLNQVILESFTNTETVNAKQVTDLYVIEFAMTKALFMLFESFERMYFENMQFSQKTSDHLNQLFNAFINLLQTRKTQDKVPMVEKALQLFKSHLSHCDLTDNTKTVVLLNINLAFRLLLKNYLLWKTSGHDNVIK